VTFCQKCGSEIKEDATFCKNCGTNTKNSQANFTEYLDDKINVFGTNNLLSRLNRKVNLVGIYVGLAVSLLVLLITPVFYGIFVSSGALSLVGLLYLVLLSMMLVGSFVTSILCCKTYSEGMANGGFLGLIALINMGFILGAVWFSAIAILSQMASAFSSFGGSSSSSVSSSTLPSSGSAGSVLPLTELIILPFLMIIVGVIGGWLGVFIKKLVKNNM
jgi:Predicted membrane protein